MHKTDSPAILSGKIFPLRLPTAEMVVQESSSNQCSRQQLDVNCLEICISISKNNPLYIIKLNRFEITLNFAKATPVAKFLIDKHLFRLKIENQLETIEL